MNYLLLGLIIFLGVHSIRIVADDWRTRTVVRVGELPWKGLYSVASLLGLGLLIWGFGLARQQPLQLWSPPTSMRHQPNGRTPISMPCSHSAKASHAPSPTITVMAVAPALPG